MTKSSNSVDIEYLKVYLKWILWELIQNFHYHRIHPIDLVQMFLNLSLSYSITWTLINFENDLFNETRHRWAGIWRFSASRSGTKSTSLKYKLILITQASVRTRTKSYINIVHVRKNHQRTQSTVHVELLYELNH